MPRPAKGGMALLLSALLVCGCASEGGARIPNPKIAEAVRSLETPLTDDERAIQERVEAIIFLVERTDVWDERESFLAMMRREHYLTRAVAVDCVRESTRRRRWVIPDDDPFKEVLLNLAVNDPTLEVRDSAMNSLRVMRDKSACETLVSLVFTDPPPGNPRIMDSDTKMIMGNYWSALFSAVKELQCPGVTIKPATRTFQQIVEIYAKADPSKFFGDQTLDERIADKSFNKMDPAEYFDESLSYLDHSSPVMRNRMGYLVARSRKPEALAPLLKAIKTDPDIAVREMYIDYLGRFDYKDACPFLGELLNETEFGANMAYSKNYLTTEMVHRQIEMTMQRLDCANMKN